MKVRGTILALAVIAALLVVAPGASARKLESEPVTRLTEAWAKKRCDQVRNCVQSAGRYCYPISDHVRRCTAQVVRRRKDGDLIQCQTMLWWELQGSYDIDLKRVGKTRCD